MITRRLVGIVAAVIALALVIALFPGLVPPDALFQYAQLKSGEVSDLHPPLMIWLWSLTDRVIAGPGGIYLLHWALYLAAAVLVANRLFRDPRWWLLGFLLLLAPPVLVVLMSVWKDSLLLGALLLAFAAVLNIPYVSPKGRWIWFFVALAAIWLAAALRHNALPALMPLLFMLIEPSPRKWGRIGKTVILTGLIGLSTGWVHRQADVHHVEMLPTVAVWDLAAISLMEGEMLLPPYALKDHTMSLERLRELFSPISNVPLCRYTEGVGREVYCVEPVPLRRGDGLTPAQANRLGAYWLRIILSHPAPYLRHRAYVACHMLDLCQKHSHVAFNIDSQQPDALEGIWYSGPSAQKLGIEPFAKPSEPGQRIIDGMIWLRYHTPLLSPWLYMGWLSVMTIWFGLKQKHSAYRPFALMVITSGWLMALPLFFIAPNLQLRYLVWPMLSGIIAALMLRRA